MCILWQMSSHNSAVSSRTNLNSCGEFTVIIYCYQLVGRLCCTHSLIHPTRVDIIPICWFYTYLGLLFLRAPSFFVCTSSDSPLLLQSNSLVIKDVMFCLVMFAWWKDAVALHLYITYKK